MVNIRKAKVRDIPTIIKLEKQLIENQDEIIKKSYPHQLQDFCFNQPQDTIAKNFASKAIHSKNGLVLIAEQDKHIVGYLLLTIRNNLPFFKLKKYGKLQTIFVTDAYRNQGISTLLKNEAISWCKEKGLTRISLDVLPKNIHTIDIYTKWGFTPFILEMRLNL